MSYFMVDIEADGPIPGDYSMVTLGAVLVESGLSRSFYGELHPISSSWVPEALGVGGYTREQTMTFDEPSEVMARFADWIGRTSKGSPRFISDNNGFDWMFVCWYFHHFVGKNPFGHSSTNLGSLYKGIVRSTFKNFSHLKKTPHTHHPLDDAIGNAEALLAMQDMGLRIALE